MTNKYKNHEEHDNEQSTAGSSAQDEHPANQLEEKGSTARMLSATESDNNRSLALSANEYSRSQIREGQTQLQNNLYDLDKQRALEKALDDVREFLASEGFKKKEHTIIRIIEDMENMIAASKKFSIGNCHEYALIALEYVVQNKPNVFAEVFHIRGGDHAFLVIGRKQGSNSNDPTTWGDEAFICDPWSNRVYPAHEYLSNTKNFYRISLPHGRQKNCTEDFDPMEHSMEELLGQIAKNY